MNKDLIILSLEKINKDDQMAVLEPIHIEESVASAMISAEDYYNAAWLCEYRIEVEDAETEPTPRIERIEAVLGNGQIIKIPLEQCNTGYIEAQLFRLIDWEDFWQEYKSRFDENRFESWRESQYEEREKENNDR